MTEPTKTRPRWFRARTLIATVGTLTLAFLALAYLAAIPGKGSTASVLIQVGVVLAGVAFFGLFLSKLVEQVNAARVGRWLESDEGREWLDSLPEDEREEFRGRFDDYR